MKANIKGNLKEQMVALMNMAKDVAKKTETNVLPCHGRKFMCEGFTIQRNEELWFWFNLKNDKSTYIFFSDSIKVDQEELEKEMAQMVMEKQKFQLIA